MQKLQSKEAAEPGLSVARGDEILTLKLPRAGLPSTPVRPVVPPGGAGAVRVVSLEGFSQKEWDLRAIGQGKVTLDEGHLLLAVQPNESGGIEGWSRGVLRGDFVLDFHHRVEDWTHQRGDTLSVEFRIAAAARAEAHAIVVRRQVEGDGSETFEVTAPGQQRIITVRGKHVDMALRRRGREWTLARFDSEGGGWIRLARLAHELPEEVYLGVAARKSGASLLQITLMLGDGRAAVIEEK